MKVFKTFIKSFEAPQESENKNLNFFFSSRIGTGRVEVSFVIFEALPI